MIPPKDMSLLAHHKLDTYIVPNEYHLKGAKGRGWGTYIPSVRTKGVARLPLVWRVG